jgi:hypothetical protein
MRILRVGVSVGFLACASRDRSDARSQDSASGHVVLQRLAASTAPRFEDFPVAASDVYRGRPSPIVRTNLGANGAYVDSVLRSYSGERPDFAGHLTVVQWGCGSPCQMVMFIDTRTGRVVPQSLNNVGGVEYQRSSRLLVADPGRPEPEDPPDCSACGRTAYYVWEGGQLRPLGSGPHPHLSR